MCRATTMDDGPLTAGFLSRPRRSGGAARLEIRAFYLRLSSSSPAAAPPAELSLAYLPAIGGAALEFNGSALPPAAHAEVRLRRVASGDGDCGAAAYASADRVAVAEGVRFEVYSGKERAAEGVFSRRPGGDWRVECLRHASAAVAEVAVLAEGGVLVRGKARASTRGLGCCGMTRLEGIPEEATDVGWGCRCGEEWEVVGDDDGEAWRDEEVEMEMETETETVRWAMEMGVWAVCVGVGLLATARRFRRKRALW